MGVQKHPNQIWLLPASILSVLSIGLYFGRTLQVGNTHFAFLCWNLLLAWLPLLLAWWLVRSLHTQRWLSWKTVILSMSWLLFLPNSLYIVTDFVHLRPYDNVSLLYDAVMFMSFALTGLGLGLASIYLVHRELIRRLPTRQVLIILGGVFLLSGFAIYLGRYLGWNSWDIILNPSGIFIDATDRLVNPERHTNTFAITLLFFVFISAVYTSFYTSVNALKGKK